MLAAYYRTHIDNQSGGTISTATVLRKGKKFDSGGELIYQTGTTSIHTATAVGNGSQDSGTTQDNTGASDRWIEAEFDIVVTVTGTPSGPVKIWLQQSVNGTDWDDAQTGILMTTFDFQAASTQRRVVTG